VTVPVNDGDWANAGAAANHANAHIRKMMDDGVRNALGAAFPTKMLEFMTFRFLFRPSRKEGLASRVGLLTDGWSTRFPRVPARNGGWTQAEFVTGYRCEGGGGLLRRFPFTRDGKKFIYETKAGRELSGAFLTVATATNEDEGIAARFAGGPYGGRPVEQPLARVRFSQPGKSKRALRRDGRRYVSLGRRCRDGRVRRNRRRGRNGTHLGVHFVSIGNNFSLSVKLLFAIFPNIEKSDLTCNPLPSALRLFGNAALFSFPPRSILSPAFFAPLRVRAERSLVADLHRIEI
jgi:hypothetical protein